MARTGESGEAACEVDVRMRKTMKTMERMKCMEFFVEKAW